MFSLFDSSKVIALTEDRFMLAVSSKQCWAVVKYLLHYNN